MGFIRTINTIAREIAENAKDRLSTRGLRINSEDMNKFELLRGAMAVEPREFGRFSKLHFGMFDEPGISGEYLPTSREILINRGSDEKLRTFLHELFHSRNLNPNPTKSEIEQAKRLFSAHIAVDPMDSPAEYLAENVAALAYKNPKSYLREAEKAFTDPRADMMASDILTGIGAGARFEAMQHANEIVRPYSGRGWLYSATPLFAQPALQTGSSGEA